MTIFIKPITPQDKDAFLDAVQRSRALFAAWINPPHDAESFRRYLNKYAMPQNHSFLAKAADGSLVGCVNINEIVRGLFQSAYLGYHAFVPYQGQGLMKQALSLVISRAFEELQLHRLEANIQPSNSASIGLVQSLGFRLEGYSPRYLKIDGVWRDHERYALTAEEWGSGV